jgi:hypothetical protein
VAKIDHAIGTRGPHLRRKHFGISREESLLLRSERHNVRISAEDTLRRASPRRALPYNPMKYACVRPQANATHWKSTEDEWNWLIQAYRHVDIAEQG